MRRRTPEPLADPAWGPDVLGPGYQQRTLELAPDDEGEAVATLVRCIPLPGAAPPPDAGLDVLYVHGWSDYFFQTELADFWTRLGVRFFALDLRKYGRSLRPHQTPGFVDELATYDEDIEAALAVMGHGVSTAPVRAVAYDHMSRWVRGFVQSPPVRPTTRSLLHWLRPKRT
jgi:hypothetical protein